ncbi:magnesium transporter [Photobacterium gaetbulicola]|uniref:Putative magnesium transporter n=1 Tax=Photobacterium gaetbulicola Gung47 TaxID=658445 RepID=A0A0C5WN46_9GAMM|nr:magnesium transporter [Photobacterium gaetbulicola]AJR08563.1 putative magnesium transporter [Photobacterium gaetbulicola Gung47]PSU01593.1 magnesium transporter [Photobacterium gaetbulicola]
MALISTPLHSAAAEKLYDQFLHCIATNDTDRLLDSIQNTDPTVLPSVFRKLTDKERVVTWVLLNQGASQVAANLLDLFTEDEQRLLVSLLPTHVIVCMFRYLRSSDRRRLINELPSEIKLQLKQALPDSWRNEENAALFYSPDTVGGICKSEILKLGEDASVADLANMLHTEEQDSELLEWRYVYLHDALGCYLGAVKIRDVLLLTYDEKLINHLDRTIPAALPEQDIHSLKSILDTTLHPVIPVVSEQGFQIGVIGTTQLNKALYDYSNQQLLEQSGVFGGEEFRNMSILSRNLRRLAFLLPSVVLSYAAVSIIAAFEPIIEQIAVLAAVLPLVANLSGAAGNQAVAVSIRELTVGHISSKDSLYVIAKELPIGALNGLVIGGVITLLTLFNHGSEYIGLPLLIGAAYTVSSMLAVMIGGALPLLLKRINLDPAMLSSPVLTTLTDAISFFSVLYLAQTFLL